MSLAAGGLADLLEGTSDDPAALRAIDDPLVRGRMVLETLRALAREGPVVVAIDDAQWLDSVSARAIRYALRRLDLEPVGLLATLRSGSEWPDALRAQSALPPGRCDVVELGPLSLGALRRVLGGVVDAISRPALARIHAASGGNPLYAIVFARSGWGSAGAALPDSLRDVLDRRLDLAPANLLPLLQAVSALGPTSVTELRPLFPEADLGSLLGATESQGLLLVENDLSVRFVHPLIGSAVYARMSPLARRALHGRLAVISVEPKLRARHLALSTDDPNLAVAAELDAAAARARGRGAPDVAADFAGHSLRLTPRSREQDRRRRAHLEIEQLAAAGEVPGAPRSRRPAGRVCTARAPIASKRWSRGPTSKTTTARRRSGCSSEPSTSHMATNGCADECCTGSPSSGVFGSETSPGRSNALVRHWRWPSRWATRRSRPARPRISRIWRRLPDGRNLP